MKFLRLPGTRRSVRCFSDTSFPWKRHTSTEHRVTAREDETIAEVELPGFTFGDLSRAGIVDASRIGVHCESCRTNTFSALMTKREDPGLEGLARVLTPQQGVVHMYFLKTAQYFLKNEFYRKDHLYFPIRWRLGVCSVGSTSLQIHQRAVSTRTEKTLLEAVTLSILVDPTTRKPTPFPDDFRKTLRVLKEPRSVPHYTAPEVSSDADVHTYTCQWSDTDVLGHVNQAQYVRICVDALSALMLTDSSRLERYEAILGARDPADAKLMSQQMLYTAETQPGENVEVLMWPGGTGLDERVVHFCVTGAKGPKFFLTLQM